MHFDHGEHHCSGFPGGHGGWGGDRGPGHGGFGGFGRGGGPGGRGPGGGRRRMIGGSELQLLVLHLMELQPRHGYDIIREIETRTGGSYAPSPGIVYPTLSLLEDQGEIEASTSGGPKRLFVLTDAGRKVLADRKVETEAVLARLDSLRGEGQQLESGPVGRAMQNLRAVVQQRFANPQEKTVMFEAADLLDEVARKIERL
jgi:DNA-binding PadR family transcriptional regulator